MPPGAAGVCISDRMMRFGVLGTGRITRRLVADLQSTEAIDVTAIASRDSDRARWFADQYGIAAAVHGYESMLRRDDVDAVYLSLPPSLHAEWSIAAAQAGKHVLCEKPLATSVADATSIDVACRKAGVRWLDATGWLHHRRTERFSQWLSDGRLGQLGHISSAVSFYQPFQSNDHRLDASLGGGCVLDLGWYACGLARFAAGVLPTEVAADVVERDGVAQRLTAKLSFPGEITATVSCGYDTATRKWFEIAGSAASLFCDDFTRPWADRPPGCSIQDAAGNRALETTDVVSQERTMIERLAGEEDLAVWHSQAIDTQRILDAAIRSAADGGAKMTITVS